jgi:hypothetical protein
MVVPDASLEPRRAAGRLDTPDEPCLGERVEGLIHGLEGNVPYAIAHPGGDRLDSEVVTVPDGLKECGTCCRHPQAGTAQLFGDGRGLVRGHTSNLAPQKRTTQESKSPKFASHVLNTD